MKSVSISTRKCVLMNLLTIYHHKSYCLGSFVQSEGNCFDGSWFWFARCGGPRSACLSSHHNFKLNLTDAIMTIERRREGIKVITRMWIWNVIKLGVSPSRLFCCLRRNNGRGLGMFMLHTRLQTCNLCACDNRTALIWRRVWRYRASCIRQRDNRLRAGSLHVATKSRA